MLKVLVLVLLLVAVTCDARARHRPKSNARSRHHNHHETDARGGRKSSSLRKSATKFIKNTWKSMSEKNKQRVYDTVKSNLMSVLDNVINKNDEPDALEAIEDVEEAEFREERSADQDLGSGHDARYRAKREQEETPLRNHLRAEMDDLEQTLETILREGGEDLDE